MALMPVSNYTIRVTDGRRDALAVFLAECGIETAIHYPRPLHLQPAFAFLGYSEGSFPEAERAAREVLSLPLYPELTVEQREYVVEQVRRFFV
jgi:dTDP-4-amino-4,6-dideoxygalactose transaminase